MIEHIVRLPDGRRIVEPMRFVHHSGITKFRPKRDITDRQLDHLAELLSEGNTLSEAARLMGIEYKVGHAMLLRIARKLGPQAR